MNTNLKNGEYVSRIHQADTDGNQFVAIYKVMSDADRKAMLQEYWNENRWGTRFGAPDIAAKFPLDESSFPNEWFETRAECERNSTVGPQ